MGDKQRSAIKRWTRRLARGLTLLVALSLLWGLAYSVLRPPITPLMVIRLIEGEGLDYRWRPLEEISPRLVQSVVGAEDSGFCQHFGVDFQAIRTAVELNEKGQGRFGASTMTMQTAKNAFLWPARSWLRKGAELYFTLMIEVFWSKRRIAEVYLNIVEWGPGIYGAEAAAQTYFGRSAAELTPRQAGLMAATLPSPRRWSPAAPTAFVARKGADYQRRAETVARDALADCILRP